MAGYSPSPLAKKLGYGIGGPVWSVGLPDAVKREIENDLEPAWSNRPGSDITAAHLFVTRRSELANHLKTARETLNDNAMIWISWPKRSSKMKSEVTEDTIRELALPLGFVDIKVCAVNETWSGLKLVVRKELRKPNLEKCHG